MYQLHCYLIRPKFNVTPSSYVTRSVLRIDTIGRHAWWKQLTAPPSLSLWAGALEHKPSPSFEIISLTTLFWKQWPPVILTQRPLNPTRIWSGSRIRNNVLYIVHDQNIVAEFYTLMRVYDGKREASMNYYLHSKMFSMQSADWKRVEQLSESSGEIFLTWSVLPDICTNW